MSLKRSISLVEQDEDVKMLILFIAPVEDGDRFMYFYTGIDNPNMQEWKKVHAFLDDPQLLDRLGGDICKEHESQVGHLIEVFSLLHESIMKKKVCIDTDDNAINTNDFISESNLHLWYADLSNTINIPPNCAVRHVVSCLTWY